MANVLLKLVGDPGRDARDLDFTRMMRAAGKDRFKVHVLVEDPEAADLIILFDPQDPFLSSDLRRHPYALNYPEKTFVHDAGDRPFPFLPGIYASMPRGHYDPRRVRPGHYLEIFDKTWSDYQPDDQPRDLLYSFRGNCRDVPVREALKRLSHPRGIVQDSSDHPRAPREDADAALAHAHREFARLMLKSRFSLCPRGIGTSSVRLFETMRAARAPVILSDDWVAPEGPDWNAFALFVREKDVARLPSLLEASEPSAIQMGRLARRAWEEWFSEEVCYHRIVESCLDITRARARPERLARRLVLWRLLQPWPFRHKLMHGLRNHLVGSRSGWT